MFLGLMKRCSTVLVVMTVAAAIASVLPVRAWPLEFLASFRVQITLLLVVSTLAAFLFRTRFWGSVGALFVALQVALSLPVLAGGGDDGRAGPPGLTLRVLTLNLEWSNREADGVIDTIRRLDPDIVALQEADPWWRRKLEPLADTYPCRRFDPHSAEPGVGFLSKAIPTTVDWRFLHGRCFPTARFDEPGRSWCFTGLHPYPPKTPRLYDIRNRQIDTAAGWIPGSPFPAIVAGDLNTTPWSPVLRDFQTTTGLISARAGRGTFPTWPSWNMLFSVPIDHIYYSDRFTAVEVRRVPIPGSDHLGLFAVLRPSGPRPGKHG